MRQLIYQVCYIRYQVSFYLSLIGSVLKNCKVPKYYDHDFSKDGLGGKIMVEICVLASKMYSQKMSDASEKKKPKGTKKKAQ